MDAGGYKRKLTAILSADVQGYSRLMGDNESETVSTLTTYREAITNLIQDHHGRVIDSPGDNLLTEFPSVVQAVECAVEIQRNLKAWNAELPDQRQMEFRIGINLGDVIEEGERIYGDGVNIAARVEGLAEGGGICISGTVYDHIENKLDLNFEDLGEHSVKNILKPIRVYKIPTKTECVTGAKDLKSESLIGPAIPDKPSIAVLPFTNMSGDPEQEYFSDGITEDLITDLAKISGLFVIARNSVFIYKGKTEKIDGIARELGVRYILEGSVRKVGDRVRIAGQLIDANTGGHLWAERYDRKLTDIFELQDEVTHKIVSALAVKITDDERNRLACKGTKNLQAYDHTLRGLEYFTQFTIKANTQARQMFEQAIKLDPEYASAYALAGGTHMIEWSFGWSQDLHSIDRAFEFIQKALKLDNSLGQAYQIAGEVFLWKKQYEKAISYYRKAISLSPNDADGFYGLSNVLSWAGQVDEAKEIIKKAMLLNPMYPVWYLWAFGHALFLNREYEEAIDIFTELLNRNENFLPAYPYLAAIYQELGREEEARIHMEKLIEKSPLITLDAWKQRLPYKDQAKLDRLFNTWQSIGVM